MLPSTETSCRGDEPLTPEKVRLFNPGGRLIHQIWRPCQKCALLFVRKGRDPRKNPKLSKVNELVNTTFLHSYILTFFLHFRLRHMSTHRLKFRILRDPRLLRIPLIRKSRRIRWIHRSLRIQWIPRKFDEFEKSTVKINYTKFRNLKGPSISYKYTVGRDLDKSDFF